jgi:hypothetical protein
MMSSSLRNETEACLELWRIIDSDDPEDRAKAKRLLIFFIEGYHRWRQVLTSPPYSIDLDDTDLVAKVDAILLEHERSEPDIDDATETGPGQRRIVVPPSLR